MANHNFVFPDISAGLPPLLEAILAGDETGSRNGRTRELIAASLTLKEPWRREILTPGRKASLPAQIAETMWVLAGRSDVGWLSHYLPRAKDYSDDGLVWRGGYGPRLRAWDMGDETMGGEPIKIDQLAWVVDLLRKDPLTRRAVMAVYNPAVDSTDGGLDHPCNDMIQFTSRLGGLDVHVFLRSSDAIWGLGINTFEWSAMQEIVAGLLGVQVGALHLHIGSLHIYDHHWEKAARLAGSDDGLPPVGDSPRFDAKVVGRSLSLFDELVQRWFVIESLIRTQGNLVSTRDAIEAFPEPMLRSWLRVIAWHWSQNDELLIPLMGTRLQVAAQRSPRPKAPEPVAEPEPVDPFIQFVVDLHAEKHAVYGDSWKRRGEQVGILANIARKIDRLGVAGGGDTAADTVIDLLVYLVKYRLWLTDEYGYAAPKVPGVAFSPPISDQERPVADVLRSVVLAEGIDLEAQLMWLITQFNHLEGIVNDEHSRAQRTNRRVFIVDGMIPIAAATARTLWGQEQQPEAKAIDRFAHNATRSWNPDV